MRLKSLDLQFDWPASVRVESLRLFVLEKLSDYGDPLRWSISNVSISDGMRQLNIEAVVIIK